MQKINAAIIGLGFVGRAHLDALRRLGISVQGVLGSTPERTKASRMRWDLPRAYASLEELAADSSVQVVHLCTPNNEHFQEAASSSRGKNVLCEKPLTLDSRNPRRWFPWRKKQDGWAEWRTTCATTAVS